MCERAFSKDSERYASIYYRIKKMCRKQSFLIIMLVMIIFIIILSPLVFAATIIDAHGVALSSTQAYTIFSGQLYQANKNIRIWNGTSEAADTATRMMILDSGQTVLENVTISNNVGEFSGTTTINEADYFFIVVDSEGASFTQAYVATSSYPFAGTNVNMTARGLANNTAYINSIISVTTEEVAADTCTAPGSGDWAIDCSDNCVFDAAQDVPGNIHISGSGNLMFSAPFTFTAANSIIAIDSGCDLDIRSGGELSGT